MSPPWFVFKGNCGDVVLTTPTSFLEKKKAKNFKPKISFS